MPNTMPQVDPATYQLQELIQDALAPIRARVAEKGTEFHLVYDVASSLTLLGDVAPQKELLRLVLNNILTYSRATRITFTIRQLLQSEKDILLEFSLIDNGFISRHTPGHFGYYRGLSSAKRQIEAMGGKAEWIAVAGVSTSLKFIIKYGYETGGRAAVTTTETLSLDGKRILVAEDNEINQKVINQILVKAGAIPSFVSNGKEAITLLEKAPGSCDLVLLDLQMPYMDGFQAASFIRKYLRMEVPVLAVTGSPANNEAKCLEVGMNGLLKKPFTAAELLSALGSALKNAPRA